MVRQADISRFLQARPGFARGRLPHLGAGFLDPVIGCFRLKITANVSVKG
jgi:hypothetical protein